MLGKKGMFCKRKPNELPAAKPKPASPTAASIDLGVPTESVDLRDSVSDLGVCIKYPLNIAAMPLNTGAASGRATDDAPNTLNASAVPCEKGSKRVENNISDSDVQVLKLTNRYSNFAGRYSFL